MINQLDMAENLERIGDSLSADGDKSRALERYRSEAGIMEILADVQTRQGIVTGADKAFRRLEKTTARFAKTAMQNDGWLLGWAYNRPQA